MVSYFYVEQCTLHPRLPSETSHWWQANVWWTTKMYCTIRRVNGLYCTCRDEGS